ncbi:para-nitrobenzyl esterase [Plantactinospora soyae]|uniref:Carboxylic ester hydrolase n=2 Tax=Plantactinospora soyae TaxID=1544732 RepID=A0A927R1S4_9ACTN|nr:para-nitrobenzyl esterase [Plantactinospora soyae]
MSAPEVRNPHKRYGEHVAVDDVSFTIGEGEIFGIIGPNGAGKTTTVESIAGLRTPDSGSISVLGLDPNAHNVEVMRPLVKALIAALVLGTALVAGPNAAAAETRHPIARTDAGWVKGTAAQDYRLFQGIPFAAPPVGELRWRSPQPVTRWQGFRDATAAGDRCAQSTDFAGLPRSESEDCLYLNVTAPRSASSRHLKPVMVWLHGGGLTTGGGDVYNPSRLAVRGDMVVVTVNYRLGVFGFFGHPGLEDAGALGLEDQQAAMRWVQRNVAAFGGDPRKVTLAGESAGSQSVCSQLVSPPAASLFQQAITQSAFCSQGAFAASALRPVIDSPSWVPRARHVAHGQTVAAGVGCADPATAVECLRRKPVADLLAQQPLPIPAFGTAVLPEDPAVVLAQGRFQRMPMLTGITRDEGTYFGLLLFPGLTEQQYRDTVAQIFGDQAPQVLAEYPSSAHGSPAQAAAAITSDLDWAWAARSNDRLFAAHMPTFAYEFTDRSAPALFPFPPGLDSLASHGSELQFLFDITYDVPPLTEEQRRLGDTMIGYWSRFVATGKPNGRDLPSWQPVRATAIDPYVQELGIGRRHVGPYDRATAHNFSFWDSLAD